MTRYISDRYPSSGLKLAFLNEMEESFETYFEDVFFAHHIDNSNASGKRDYVSHEKCIMIE